MKTAMHQLKERLLLIGFTGVDEFIDEYIENIKRTNYRLAFKRPMG